MIFNRFFRPAWQNADPVKRQTAVATLEPDNQSHRTILRELAFNDGHRQVRRAALEKLNELSLWWLAAGEERDEGLKRLALNQVTEFITAASATDTKQVKAFVADCKDRKYLESVWRQLPATELRKRALKRIDKLRCFIDAAEKESDSSLALWAAEKVTEEKQMRRLMKRAALADVRNYFEQALNAIQEAKQRPAQLNEQARLLLAQLQDVTDKLIEPQAVDNPALAEKVYELQARWEELSPGLSELDLLPPWQSKLEAISKRLTPRLNELAATWKEAIVKAAALQEQQENASLLDGGFAALAEDIKSIHKQLELQQAYDVEPLVQVLAGLKDELNRESLTENDRQRLVVQANNLTKQVETLAELPAQQKAAEDLIAQLNGLNSDNDNFLDQFSNWKKAWKLVKSVPLSAQSKQALDELLQPLEQAKKAQIEARKTAEGEVVKLLAKAERHQNAGRLKVAVREFHRLAEIYSKLDPQTQRRFERRYNKLAEVERELLEWHQLVALPKADGLLAEIKALAESPSTDPLVQAEAVKDARRRWQLLEIDRNEDSWQPLAEQFDQLSEKAFESCRQFYAEQQQEREQHLAEREQLIEAMSTLASTHKSSPLPLNDLESQYRQIANSWRQAGEVDFTKRKAVQSRYLKAARKVTDSLKQLYGLNEADKQRLLKQAEALDLNDVAASSELFDGLMKRWREVGYAGNNEKQLWQRFQHIGQQLREKRELSRSQQRGEWQEHAAAFEALLQQFSDALSVAADDAAIHHAVEQARQASATIGELAHKDRRRLTTELEELEAKAEQLLAARQKVLEQRNYNALIEVITTDNDKTLDLLPERWQKSIRHWQQESAKKPADADLRERLIIEAELLAGLDSPASSEALRQQLRLALLQAHMNGGSSQTVESLFWQWLEAGAVNVEDKSALQRFQRALTANIS